ncbi:MAG: hypothetical protein BLM47_12430 [Candidatus Reconcilbacillus cellulovorans]|uniref:Peptidase S8/S53 domain-containing protein n=1 Tax=Candidatus Reconcilbacillus cellulovorans TaxID=1906605 RepID=A0A2A6DXM4_9BACL|nr:MAG: hypothetical protein BLM47_12430 [Candidatus Reconcilbacillus cellulovorans]
MMKLNSKKKKPFVNPLLTGLLAAVVMWGTFEIPAGAEQTQSAVSDRSLVVFKSGRIPNGVVEALLARSGVKVTAIPDIGVVAVKSETPGKGESIKEFLFSRFGRDIEVVGEDFVLTLKHDLNRPVGEMLSLSSVRFALEDVAKKAGAKTDESDVAAAPAVDVSKAVLYQQWGWDIRQVTGNGKSFEIQPGNPQVKVAVIDSGIDPNHPDLKNNLVSTGRSFVPGDPSTADDFGHGTMVAGTIAANGLLLGVGPRLGLIPYRVFQNGDADSNWVIQAIIQAVKDGVDVINLSLGTYKSLKNPSDKAVLLAYEKAVAYALANGVMVVASSGTDGLDIGNPAVLAAQRGQPGDLQVHAPGGLPGVLTVAATNRDQGRAFYSNYGWNVDIAAPGGDFGPLWEQQLIADVRYMCLVTYPTNLPQTPLSQWAGLPKGYEWMIGTSLAAPKVAAAAALVIAQEKEKWKKVGYPAGVKLRNALRVRDILEKSAVDIGPTGRDSQFGVGLLDVVRALQAVR